MSAICGLYHRGGGVAAGLPAMLRALSRGGVEHPRWDGGGVSLGAVGGAAPYTDAEARVTVVLAGRIHDREHLCGALGLPPPERAGTPDAALVARAYARWRRECPHHLHGEYAFALWDERDRSVFCARDAAGAQPFYYALTPHRLAFAGDLRAVLAAPGVPDALDEVTIATWLTRIDPSLGDRTFFRAIRKLPPGHTLTVGADAADLARWWRPEEAPEVRLGGDDEYADAFLELYGRAVADRVRDAGPVGVHLSGGLDSSSVTVLAAAELRRRGHPPPTPFSWLPPPPAGRPRTADEARQYGAVEAVCEQEGLPRPVYCLPGIEEVMAWFRRDPVLDDGEGSLMIEGSLQRHAAERGVRLLLSGWGGDEGISFHGRGYYPWLLLSGQLGRLIRECRPAGNLLEAVLRRALLPLVSKDAPRMYKMLRSGVWPFPGRPFLHPTFRYRVELLPASSWRESSVRHVQLRLLHSGHLSRRMEAWSAQARSSGIEYGYPLLDRRVLELALGLPPEQYVRRGWGRWLMRYAFRWRLPFRICWNRNKSEPVMDHALSALVGRAKQAIRRDLSVLAETPHRARYLDMRRLMGALDEAWSTDRALRSILTSRALQLLDF